MRTPRRGFLRRLSPMLAALLAVSAGTVGLAASPAAADANLQVALTVITPLPGGAANTVYVGQPLSYQLTVTAGASGLAGGVTFTDTLPTDLAYGSVTPAADWACTTTPVSPATVPPSYTLSCSHAAALAANAVSTATVALTMSATTTLTSVSFNPAATGSAPTTPTPTPATGGLAAADVAPVAPAADISVTKTVNPPPPGQVSYSVAVTNLGPSTAAAPITVNDTVPAGLTWVSTTPPAGMTCTAPGAAGAITCTGTNPLAMAETATVTVVATVASGSGAITTGASASSATFDPNLANNTAVAPQGAVAYGTAADPGPCGVASATVPPVRTCNLVAAPGTVAVPNFLNGIPIWGFAIDKGPSTAGTIPGPTLVVNEGETLRLVVRNALPVHGTDTNMLAVQIPGTKTVQPDATGVPSGATTTATAASYNWAGLAPGTYVYEAGQTQNGARQLAMGLAGVLIVRPTGFNPTPTGTAPRNLTLFDPPAVLLAAPATACANPTGSSQFTAEQMVVVNELNSEFHSGTNPFTSTMSPGGGNGPINNVGTNTPGGSADIATYAPDVFLVNGQAYPSTNVVPVTPVTTTDCVALHYANLGMLEKSFGVLGQRQTVMADDSVKLAHPQNQAVKYLNPGQQTDAVVDMTGSTPGTTFPIMDFGRHLHNGNGSPNNPTSLSSNTGMTLGGQLALLQVAGAQPATISPVVDQVGLDHTTVAVSKTNAVTPAQLNLTSHPVARNAGSITGGQFTIDNIPLLDATTGQPVFAAGTNYRLGNVSAAGTAVVNTSTMAGLTNGDHVIWVRAQDNQGHWADPPAGVVFTYDAVNANGGPTINDPSIDPTASNANTPDKVVLGSAGTPGTPCAGPPPITGVPALYCDFIIGGSATPSLPDWSISGFTWQIAGGAGGNVPLSGGPGAPVDLFTAVPPGTFLAGLPQGNHLLTLTATEAQGANSRDGNPVTIPFVYTTQGPTASIVSMTPSPAGPASDHSANANYFPSVRIRGTFTDPLVQIAGGEMWFLPNVNGFGPVGLDPAGNPSPDGQAVEVTPDGGTWTAPPSTTPVPFFVDIPSNEFNGLPQGLVRVYVHGKDVAGNWGSWTPVDLVVDKTQPVVLDKTPVGGTESSADSTVAQELADHDPVLNTTAGHTYLDFWAQDPATVPPVCTVSPTGQITPLGCGIAETSKVTAVEWTSGSTTAENGDNQDFTYILPAPSDGPVHIQIDVTAAFAAATSNLVNYRVRDGAGNWTDWQIVTAP